MGANDRQVRNEAATQRASIFGHNYSDDTDYDTTAGAWTSQGGYSDLCPLVGINTSNGNTTTPTPAANNVIRILQPHQGEVVECYIEFIMIRPAYDAGQNSLDYYQLYIGVGDYTNNDFMTPRTDYTIEEIKAQHKLITGSSDPIYMDNPADDRIYASKLNLLPVLKKADDPLYVEDGIPLVLQFVNTDDDGNEYLVTPIGGGVGGNFLLEDLRIVMSITGVK